MNTRARRTANRRVSYTMDILRWREGEGSEPERAPAKEAPPASKNELPSSGAAAAATTGSIQRN